MTIKRVAIYTFALPVGLALYQGFKIKAKWSITERLEPPSAVAGIEELNNDNHLENHIVIQNLKKLKNNILRRIHEETISTDTNNTTNTDTDSNNIISTKLKLWMEKVEALIIPSNNGGDSLKIKLSKLLITNTKSHPPPRKSKTKKIKLVIIGDSLAAG